MTSIRRTLLLGLSVGLSGGILAAAGLVYFQAREEANELFDYQMKQLVASLPSQSFAPLAPSRAEEANMQEDIVIQIWDGSGLRIYHSHEQTDLPQRAELGFSSVNTPGGAWRVYSRQLGNTTVQVAQPLSARRAVATKMAVRTMAPLILLFPFLAGLIWITVGRGLSAVKRAAEDVQARDAGSLSPVSGDGLPQEIQPLVQALNGLLSRLSVALDAQRAFVADAAHELKTPLTALGLQIRLAERAESAEDRKHAFAELKQGLERAIHLVHQLLTLARQEPGAFEQAQEDVDLVALARNVVADFVVAADAKLIDLGIKAEMPAHVTGNPAALRILLSNLVDNAIRYSPNGGRIDVSIQSVDRTAALIVQDAGPGIPEADLARVIDRFYRVTGTQAQGSGLGLSIVKRIAETHDADITLTNTGNGLRACVTFNRAVKPAIAPADIAGDHFIP